MAQYPQFIDNKRKTLSETLRKIAPVLVNYLPNFHWKGQ